MEDTDGCLLFAEGGVWCLPNKKKLTTSSTVKNRRDCKPFLWRHDASLIPVTASAVCVMEEARLWPPLIGRRLAAPLPPITIKGKKKNQHNRGSRSMIERKRDASSYILCDGGDHLLPDIRG
ncbi:hypothetical protein QYF36_016278 [Acer negundo]|nr:hypothetical protein QYF36_016278 [Acer negundo]